MDNKDKKGNIEELSDANKKLLELTNIAIGEIPKTYTEFGQLIWKAFDLGIEYEKAKTKK